MGNLQVYELNPEGRYILTLTGIEPEEAISISDKLSELTQRDYGHICILVPEGSRTMLVDLDDVKEIRMQEAWWETYREMVRDVPGETMQQKILWLLKKAGLKNPLD